MKNRPTCVRCGSTYPAELESGYNNLCEPCARIAVKDIMGEWWEAQDALDQDEMILAYIESLKGRNEKKRL